MSHRRRDDSRTRSVFVVLILAALAVISIDAGVGGHSPTGPARSAAGSVLGPAQTALTGVVQPLTAVADLFGSRDDLRAENATLRKENAALRAEVNTADGDRARLAEYDGVTTAARDGGFKTVDARVVGIGSAQDFERTVTIDVGTGDGVRRDMTVINADGLVGRIIGATRSNATVLLIIDSASVVGARLGSDHELGFLRGDGDLSGAGRLTLTAVDASEVAKKGDSVVSWGSRKGVPYVADVPIGRVEHVSTSPREQTSTATVAPYVDFSALDVVSVVVGKGKGH